ncbi:hypothetical protein MT325_m129L [Paramecium bursaria chlorella virus MT325]|uniref:Uncharacterized protein m129L n=1 Tax=Paramecium bursaria Chlorella virus MT325 TaxID=346932 RepID=A7ITK9_PBCVM|nr:hypothetical protein MT325_m129L [Paramecium bursaria chlorella virus MT325]
MLPSRAKSIPDLAAPTLRPTSLLHNVPHNICGRVAPTNSKWRVHNLLTTHQNLIGEATIISICALVAHESLCDPRVLDLVDDVDGVGTKGSTNALDGLPQRLGTTLNVESGEITPRDKHAKNGISVPNLALTCHRLDVRVARQRVHDFENGIIFEDGIAINQNNRVYTWVHTCQLKPSVKTLPLTTVGLEDTNVFRNIRVDRGTVLVLALAQNNPWFLHIVIIHLLVDFSHLQVFLLIAINDTNEPGDIAILRVTHALQTLFKHKRVLAIAGNYDCHSGGVPIVRAETDPI